MRRQIARLMAGLMLVVLSSTTAVAQLPQPLGQPLTGPGGKGYPYEQVRVSAYGQGADGYWLFEPRDVGGKALPAVLFVHGLNQTHYAAYWLWIRHLVLRGNVVIYPRYQSGVWLDPATFTGKCAASVREGLKRLDGEQHAKADPQRFAMIGHSLGGTMIANLAARAQHFGIPRAGALMLLLAGDVRADTGLGMLLPSIMDDHSTIPRGTLMLSVVVERDNIVGQSVAKWIHRTARQVAAHDKALLEIGEDDHGQPALAADHFLPLSYLDRRGVEQVDAYDFTLWRWFDALQSAVFNDGKHRELVLGNTPEQVDTGRWSDGKAVRKAAVIEVE